MKPAIPPFAPVNVVAKLAQPLSVELCGLKHTITMPRIITTFNTVNTS